jgi:hypothetical protein
VGAWLVALSTLGSSLAVTIAVVAGPVLPAAAEAPVPGVPYPEARVSIPVDIPIEVPVVPVESTSTETITLAAAANEVATTGVEQRGAQPTSRGRTVKAEWAALPDPSSIGGHRALIVLSPTEPAEGTLPVAMTIDYSDIAGDFGAGQGDRLRAVALVGCTRPGGKLDCTKATTRES